MIRVYLCKMIRVYLCQILVSRVGDLSDPKAPFSIAGGVQ